MNIYELELEINRVIMDGMTEDGELTSEAEAALEQHAEQAALWYKNVQAYVSAIKAEIETLTQKKKRSEHTCEYIKKFFARRPELTVKTPRVSVSRREMTRVDKCDIDVLDARFVVVKTERVPDKRAILAAYKSGEEVNGADIGKHISVTIK